MSENQVLLSIHWDILVHYIHMFLMWRETTNCKVVWTYLQFLACKRLPTMNKSPMDGMQLSCPNESADGITLAYLQTYCPMGYMCMYTCILHIMYIMIPLIML